jgi:hypothetical protein
MVFVSIETVYRSESKTQVVNFLVNILKVIGTVLEVICYDDMCHLAKFIEKRKDHNEHMSYLNTLRKYIDRFHLKNHRDENCKKIFDPDLDPSLKGVNTEVCEQTNAWLRGFQSTVRQMNPDRFKVFMLYMCHLHNVELARGCCSDASS